MAEIAITREDRGQEGRYVARIEGVAGEAELIYARRAADLVSADHTLAPDSMRGTGAAAALVGRLVADARNEGFKIIPRCSYVAASYAKHPEWADLFVEP